MLTVLAVGGRPAAMLPGLKLPAMADSFADLALKAAKATHPERVRRLVLYGTYASGDALAPIREEKEAWIAIIRSSWSRMGARSIVDTMVPSASPELADEYTRLLHSATSPENGPRSQRLP